MNHLERIVATTRKEVERRRTTVPEDELEAGGRARRESGDVRPFEAALAGPGLSLIAEHKRRSPSAGEIRGDVTVEEVVQAYERGGAAAISVLTEGPSFGGSLDDLGAARAACTLPVLRKDFIVGSYQLHEALAAGADAILLIVAALPATDLAALHRGARDLGLAALVEVHDERELSAALDTGVELIGINNRDLTTLEVDTRRTFELRERIPPSVTVVAESGFSSREDIDRLEAAGIDAVLIGEALMRAGDIEQAARALSAR